MEIFKRDNLKELGNLKIIIDLESVEHPKNIKKFEI